MMVPLTRRVSWVRAALRAFEGFPEGIKTPMRDIALVRERLKALREMLQ